MGWPATCYLTYLGSPPPCKQAIRLCLHYTGSLFVTTWKVIQYSVNSNCTELEQVVDTHQTSVRCTNINTNLHFHLSRVPVIAPTHLLPLQFEYLFTLTKSDRNLSNIWRSTFKIGAVPHCCITKIEPKSPLLCVNMCRFFMSAEELSSIVRT